eukprot:gene39728-53711_t
MIFSSRRSRPRLPSATAMPEGRRLQIERQRSGDGGKAFECRPDRVGDALGDLVTFSEAIVKVKVGDEVLISAAEGAAGPVNALDVALRKDLGRYQSLISGLRLVDYKVRIFQGGTDAVTRVLIESADETGERWTTVGVSANIIDASFELELSHPGERVAGARAAASLSLTIAVACATLLVVGGILAGPTLIECSHKPGSLMACVDEKLARWEGPSEAPSSEAPQVASSSSSVALSAPLLVESSNEQPGWIDARATEYEPPRASSMEAPVPSAEFASVASPASSVPDAQVSEAPADERPSIDLSDFGAVAPLAGIPPALLTTSVTAPAVPRPVLAPPPTAPLPPSWVSAPPITGSIAQPPLEAIVEPPPMPRPAIEVAAPQVEPGPPADS